MTLTPIEIRRKITIRDRSIFNVYSQESDSGDVVHSFEIPFTEPVTRLWIEQHKDQWIITEYKEEQAV